METTCCIIGGGPAGIMLGYLLARAGVPVTVLEKHTDFFRDFRGDTIHPSTLQLLSRARPPRPLPRNSPTPRVSRDVASPSAAANS
jgi:2-polyprenyl-6-methoxyphenol hydroxylase-like FAD-dependent oxidoreductase